MIKKYSKYLKLIVCIAIVIMFVWFLVIYPMVSFKQSENKMLKAAQRYYEINPSMLPSGTRIKTLSLQDLYTGSYLKEDIYIPYTDKPCDLKESWVKVRQENGKYKYFVYLKCGAIESNGDHKGPKIKLNGKEEMVVSRYSKFNDPGISSVVDNTDGNLDKKDVIVKGQVDTSEIGTYELTYIAFDKLKNKSEVKRKVIVKEVLKDTIKTDTETGYYSGDDAPNFLRLSGMMFRIIGIDKAGIRIVAETDISNVNYDGLDKWFDYYLSNFSNEAKKLLVKNEYCNMSLTDTTLDTTKCDAYTEKRYVYIPSITDINLTTNAESGTFLKLPTMSWTANKQLNTKKAYITWNTPFQEGKPYISFPYEDNWGVRPVLTLKPNVVVKSGDGTYEEPYELGDIKKPQDSQYLNERYVGEYFLYSDYAWKIVEKEKNGPTKAIAMATLLEPSNGDVVQINYPLEDNVYNPKKKDNIGYYINNKASKYFNTDYIVNHEVKVPIYSGKIKYQKEVTTKKYNLKVAAPNMYEMFSAYEEWGEELKSYWMINSSKKVGEAGAVFDRGPAVNGGLIPGEMFGIRPVVYFNKNVVITSGHGTSIDPYVIRK